MQEFGYSHKRKFPALVALLLLTATIACVGTQSSGELPADCSATEFDLLGEVDHTWEASVTPDHDYTLILTQQRVSYPMNQMQATVLNNGEDIGYDVSVTDNRLEIGFTGPEDGDVGIIIISLAGENQEDAGSFTIQLCEE